MNHYKLRPIDQELIALIKEYQHQIPKAETILVGVTIRADSENEARKEACKNFSIMISQDVTPAATLPEFPEVNSMKYTNLWLDKNLTSCELISNQAD